MKKKKEKKKKENAYVWKWTHMVSYVIITRQGLGDKTHVKKAPS